MGLKILLLPGLFVVHKYLNYKCVFKMRYELKLSKLFAVSTDYFIKRFTSGIK